MMAMSIWLWYSNRKLKSYLFFGGVCGIRSDRMLYFVLLSSIDNEKLLKDSRVLRLT